MNKKLLVIFFGFLALAASTGQTEEEDHFTVNQAADLLKDLLDDAQQNLSELQGAWEVKKPILESIIACLEGSLANKQEECALLDNHCSSNENDIVEAQNYVDWLEKRIQENTDQIAKLLESRCEQNGNYIEGLKNDKLALKLLQFLRAQIEAKENFDFIQKKKFMKKLTHFLQVYRTGSYEQLVQLEQDYVNEEEWAVNPDTSVKDRTAEEIGTGHVDNDQGNIEVDSFQNGQRQGWYQVKQELLELLNNLEKTIAAKMKQAQDDEVNSNSAAADFKIKLEREIEVYQGELAKWQQTVINLNAAAAQNNQNVAQCRSEEAAIQGDLEGARKNLTQETATFQHKQSNLQEEVVIFNEVIALYNPTHTDQHDDFKERVEDYNDNQNFDNGDYNDREIPKIDFLKPQ